ncbi:MAG: PhoH family protein, partial [Alphaproteobacteria bacterium]|nr:PhoH family protein [Alphaproteobacteria bacterium]
MSSSSETTEYLKFDDNKLLPLLFGEHDQYLARIEEALHVKIVARGNHIAISGTSLDINSAQTILNELYQKLAEGISISSGEVDAAIRLNLPPKRREKKAVHMQQRQDVKIPTRRRVVMAHTLGQAKYIQALQSQELIFAIGPAGTGKTYLAVATGVSMILQGKFDRII